MIVNKDFPRPDPKLVEAMSGQAAATLHEALGQQGAMATPIKPLYPGMKVCGPALTVDGRPGDNLAIHYAISLARPGDVLVVDAKGFTEGGPWGDIMTTAAMTAGIAGLVIDGTVRDAEEIRSMGFSIFCRGTSMKGTTKMLPGDINVPIVCAGVGVSPGDIIVGDDDGVVVVPREEAAGALERATAREADEMIKREKILAGTSTIDVLGLGGLLRELGAE